MDMIVLGYVFTYGYLVLVLLITGLLQKKYKLKPQISRKIIHVAVSFTWLIMFFNFGDSWHIIIPPLTFLFINYYSLKHDTLKMMELEEKTWGTVFYALSILILAIISLIRPDFYYCYGIGVFCMAFGDGFAAIIGNSKHKCNYKFANGKSLFGTITAFLFSLLVVVIFNFAFVLSFSFYKMVIIALISAILELGCKKGYDNISVPIGVAIFTYLI